MTAIIEFFKSLICVYFEMHKVIVESIMDSFYRQSDLGWAIVQLILWIVILIFLLILDALIGFGVYALIRRIVITCRTKKVRHRKVYGIVTGKDYKEDYVTYTYIGKSMIPVFYPEEYNVEVQYKEMEESFNDEELFNNTKKGIQFFLY